MHPRLCGQKEVRVVILGVYVGVVLSDPMLYRLYDEIMRNYEKDVRPAKNHSRSLNVTFGFSLTQIIDVDERNQILTSNAWINQMWIDYKLSWKPALYGNISKLHIPHDRVWRPDIVLYNNADSQYNTAIVSTDVFITSDGNITWLSAAIFKRYYPFDEQSCLLKFSSWAYDGSMLDLILLTEEGDISNYMASTEWDLISIAQKKNVQFYSCCDDPYPDITIAIKLRRKPMFYVFNLILPCVLITGIALLGFYMPSDSGEKVTLGITTLLSMTVFLMLVAESMPPTSDTLPLIGMYYGVTICLVSFATALTVFTLNIHHKGLRGSPVPKYVKIIAFKYMARGLCIQLDPPGSQQGGSDQRPYDPAQDPEVALPQDTEHLTRADAGLGFPPTEADANYINGGFTQQRARLNRVAPSGEHAPAKDNFETQFLKVLNKVYATIERNEMRLAEQDRKDAVKLEWQQVALVIDRFLLIVFIAITTFASLCIIYQRELNIGQ